MTDDQKAKDAFSIHQDRLFWSRTQTLIAIQGGVLAGTYALRDTLQLAVPLMILGIALTVMLWIIAERDQGHRDLAFEQTGLKRTRPESPAIGRALIRAVFALLIAADAYLVGWLIAMSR